MLVEAFLEIEWQKISLKGTQETHKEMAFCAKRIDFFSTKGSFRYSAKKRPSHRPQMTSSHNYCIFLWPIWEQTTNQRLKVVMGQWIHVHWTFTFESNFQHFTKSRFTSVHVLNYFLWPINVISAVSHEIMLILKSENHDKTGKFWFMDFTFHANCEKLNHGMFDHNLPITK